MIASLNGPLRSGIFKIFICLINFSFLMLMTSPVSITLFFFLIKKLFTLHEPFSIAFVAIPLVLKILK